MMSIKRLAAAFVLTLAAVSAAFAIPAPWVPLLWQPDSVHNGISLDFANQRYYTKAPGAPAIYRPFTDIFTVTRNSVGSFRGQSGLIEYANENRSIRSAPTSAQLGVSIGVVDDSATVWGVFPTGTAGISFGDNSITRAAYTNSALIVGGTGSSITASVYVRMGDSSAPVLGVDAATGDFAILANGLYPSAQSSFSQECRLVALTDIYRCALTFVQGASGANNYGIIKTNTHSAKTFIVTGFQFQFGRSAGPLLTTTGTAKFDQPRIEYGFASATEASRPLGFLAEVGRTNVMTFSEDLAGADWAALASSLTSNSIAAPDGALTADLVTEDGGVGVAHGYVNNRTLAVSTIYSTSVWVKANGRTWAVIRFTGTGWLNSDQSAFFNIVGLGTVGTLGTGVTGTISPYANGWYRIRATYTTAAAAGTGTGTRFAMGTGDTVQLYNGDGVSGMYFWGVQQEIGQFETSYIPSHTTSSTRAIDNAQLTLGPEYSNAAGTIVVTGTAGAGQSSVLQALWYLFGGSDNLFVGRAPSSDLARLNAFTTSLAQGPADGGSFVNLTSFRSASAWRQTNDLAHSLNGGTVGEDSISTLGTFTAFILGSDSAGPFGGHILRFDYWPERKPNSFLIMRSTPGPQSFLLWPANDNEKRSFG